MRKINFEVPTEAMGDFTAIILEMGLDNSIVGKTEDGHIEVEISYEKEDTPFVDELEEFLTERIGELEDEENENLDTPHFIKIF
jgi:hypothetical protein